MRFTPRLATLVALSAAVFSPQSRADDKSPAPANKDAKKYVQVGGPVFGKLEKLKPGESEAVLEYQAGIGKYAKKEKMDLTFADEVKVWFKTPPERLDENGNPKKLTPAELDKLKSHYGATKGLYAGEMSDLHSGQTVQVVFGKPRDAVKKPVVRDKNAPAEKEFVYVTQIVVTADEKPPTKQEKKK
jgi:hypothetical protein